MFVQGIHTCAFAVIYTSIETSPNATTLWADFWTIFFLLSVSARLKKNNKIYKNGSTLLILYYTLNIT